TGLIGGLSLNDWKCAGEALLATRGSHLLQKAIQRAAVGAKNGADRATRAAIKRVVAGVISSPDFGENSALYRAMGYVPSDECKGPSKKSAIPVAPPTAAAPVAPAA